MAEEIIKEPVIITENSGADGIQMPPLPQVQPAGEGVNLSAPVPSPEPPKPANKKVFLGILVALLILIVASLGVYFWLGTKLSLFKGDQSQSQITPTPTVTSEEIQELETIEIGEVDPELQQIETDLSNL